MKEKCRWCNVLLMKVPNYSKTYKEKWGAKGVVSYFKLKAQ